MVYHIVTVKCIPSYSFHSIVLKSYRALWYNMRITAYYDLFDDQTIFKLLANFLNNDYNIW